MSFLPKFLCFGARSATKEIEKALQAQEEENERREGHQRNCYSKDVCEASLTFRTKPWGPMREIPCTFDQQLGARKQWIYPGPETPHLPLELLMEQCDVAPDEQRTGSSEWLNVPKCHLALQVSAAVITSTPGGDHMNTESASDHGVEMPEMKVPVNNSCNVHPNSLDGEDAQPTPDTTTEDNSIQNISDSHAHATTLLTSTSGTPIRTFTCIRESWTEKEKTARDQQYTQTLKRGDMIPWVRFLDGKDWAVVEQRKTCDSGYRSGHGN